MSAERALLRSRKGSAPTDIVRQAANQWNDWRVSCSNIIKKQRAEAQAKLENPMRQKFQRLQKLTDMGVRDHLNSSSTLVPSHLFLQKSHKSPSPSSLSKQPSDQRMWRAPLRNGKGSAPSTSKCSIDRQAARISYSSIIKKQTSEALEKLESPMRQKFQRVQKIVDMGVRNHLNSSSTLVPSHFFVQKSHKNPSPSSLNRNPPDQRVWR